MPSAPIAQGRGSGVFKRPHFSRKKNQEEGAIPSPWRDDRCCALLENLFRLAVAAVLWRHADKDVLVSADEVPALKGTLFTERRGLLFFLGQIKLAAAFVFRRIDNR